MKVSVRTPHLALQGVSKYWFAKSPAASHVANAVNLLFPAGERFFIRSVRYYLDRVSPELRAEVRGFFGQEGRHAYAHERYFDTMRAQGFDIDPILADYERVAYDYIEKTAPRRLRLAVTVALEHFTAILAEDALDEGSPLAFAEPEMRRLLEWHAVEELEHKAVAFDVLKAVSPSYVLRIAGLLVATVVLGGFWIWALRRLLAQDGMTLRQLMKELDTLREKGGEQGKLGEPVTTRVFLRGIREYLRPSFHPMDRDHSGLIARTLDRLAAEGVVDGGVAMAAE